MRREAPNDNVQMKHDKDDAQSYSKIATLVTLNDAMHEAQNNHHVPRIINSVFHISAPNLRISTKLIIRLSSLKAAIASTGM